uniref:Uncharacterized protein n=1 Tax=Lepeophtheirus salmonis TaxID=72036 RepID=A0A0K2USY0_LEPSM
MVSFVENSAIAGSSGIKYAGRILERRDNLAPTVLALLRLKSISLIFLECRIGTSLIDSTPPAMQMSYTPAEIRPAQLVMDWFEDMHAIVTVCAGILSEKPAPRAASLAIFEVFTSWITVPTQM